VPQLVTRILLAGLLIPTALLIDLIAYIVIDRTSRWPSQHVTLVTNTAACVFVEVSWLLIWRRSVRWTRGRVISTVGCFALTTIAGVVAGWVVARRIEDEVGIFTGTWFAAVLWCAATSMRWRETSAERVERLSGQSGRALVCPACGYNLTGLREARCPECGAEFTLDALYAAQPARAISDVENA
jgi:uncharacterized membrane protein YfcA